MHLATQITDLAIILGVAAIVSFVFQRIKQPMVLGYLLAGVIVGPHTPTGLYISDLSNVRVWGELGVIFLMFALGLEFSFHKLVRVGMPAVGSTLVEVTLMISLGYAVGKWLGWTTLDSLFLGGIISISSTSIILKAYDELGVKTRRFAETVMGVLIVEDLVAILLLVAFSTAAFTQTLFSTELLVAAMKLVLIVGGWFIVGYFLIPSFLRYAGSLMRNETLTVFASALCLVMVVLATNFHYSPALGAFIMGSILAETSESHRIEHLILPLRDLFAAVFFVSVGMLVDPKVLTNHGGAIALITIVTIFGKIFTNVIGALLTGHPLKRSVQVGCSLAQIGEFSFIIAGLGMTLGVTSGFLYPIAVSVSVITAFMTPYLIRFSEPLAVWLTSVVPPAFSRRLAGYTVWAQNPSPDSPWKRYFLRYGINAILVTLIFVTAAELGRPKLREHFPDLNGTTIISWLGAVLLSAPFVWGMFFAFRPRDQAGRTSRRASDYNLNQFVGNLSTVFWVGLLSGLFFPVGPSLMLTLLGMTLLFLTLYRRLERSYRWFEKRFLANIKGKHTPEAREEATLFALAPWDVHTVRLTVHQNSALSGHSIKKLEIRSRYGVNIVAIQRGLKVIASPTADDIIFPKDELLVLGTDEQIEAFRGHAELPTGDKGDGRPLSEYALRRVRIPPQSPLIGQSIRDSRLRENVQGLVVGLERGTLRTINPDPAMVLQSGDLLWVVSS